MTKQEHNTEAWMYERELDLLIRDKNKGMEEPMPTTSTPLTIEVDEPDPAVKPGQIRILGLRPEWASGTYHIVLVLREPDKMGNCHVMQFSPYTVPACTTEYATGYEEPECQVLEGHCTIPMTTSRVASGRVVKEVSAEDLAKANDLFKAVVSGRDDALDADRIGMPITDVDDIRLPYLAEENRLLRTNFAEVIAEFYADED